MAYIEYMENNRTALRDKAIHYDQTADQTACGRNSNLRLVTVEPQTLTCKKCRKTLAAHPGWRRGYRNW